MNEQETQRQERDEGRRFRMEEAPVIDRPPADTTGRRMERAAGGCAEQIGGDKADIGVVPFVQGAVGSYVYVMGATHGPRKVGISASITERRSVISSQVQADMHVFFSVALNLVDARMVEKGAHKILAPWKVHGEWFDVDAMTAISAVEQAIKESGCALPDEAMLAFPTKGSPISIRIEADVKAALVEAAKADNRPVSQYVETLIIAHLGQLAPSKNTHNTKSRPPRPSSGRQK